MPDIELLTEMDRALVARGLIGPRAGDLHRVHAMMREYRSSTGPNFSEQDMKRGERRLRRWLSGLRARGIDEGRLAGYLMCGLGHLCRDFVEFTYELITPEEITDRALRSFTGRKYHLAKLAAPRRARKHVTSMRGKTRGR